ncbi:MAG: outer membrane protein assembly factor BamD (BamD/ComL family) [Pirellulaceae bacterium]|jgi:outer membrane protein assembly factor BamD (BamD/ComL family)
MKLCNMSVTVTAAVAILAINLAGCSVFNRDTGNADSTAQFDGAQVGYDKDVKDGLSASDFAPQRIGGTLKRLSAGQPAINEKEARSLYARAEEIFERANGLTDKNEKQRLFVEASGLFKQAAELFPESSVEHDGLFMTAEANFFADRYEKANDTYELLIKKYPNSRLLDAIESRRMAIASYWLSLDDASPQSFLSVNYTDQRRPFRDTYGHALRIYDRIRLDDPTGKFAAAATMALANAHFRSGKYIEADTTYTDLRATYPDSEHQFMAHLLGMKAKLLSYQGPSYSSGSLTGAEKLIEQINKLFRQEAREHQDDLEKSMAEIRKGKAERELMMAKFYDAKGENGYAKFHYEIVAREYGDTPIGQAAQTRVAALSGKPAKPPERLSWLVDLFPDNEEVKPLMNGDENSLVR